MGDFNDLPWCRTLHFEARRDARVDYHLDEDLPNLDFADWSFPYFAVTECEFTQLWDGPHGGALSCHGSCSCLVTDCSFSFCSSRLDPPPPIK
jgi:hypothetical protein